MSPGSFLTPKGEDSEEDEDTEYFDAMEDATSFITVITEAKEDRWALPGRLPWRDPLLGQLCLPCSCLCSICSSLHVEFKVSVQVAFVL